MGLRRLLFLFVGVLTLWGCEWATDTPSQNRQEPDRTLSNAFQEYWYAGKAEISSYSLEQERYGEMRDGSAVLIFVTEDFLPDIQVKADNPEANSVSVLKSNSMKNFVTGIYPYSIMSSTFSPIPYQGRALKTVTSVQEWCGQMYAQINYRNELELDAHSYFEGEADQRTSLGSHWLEDEIWTRIRIAPEELPTSSLTIIPGLEYCRLRHKPIVPQKAQATSNEQDSLVEYRLKYPKDSRIVRWWFEKAFPHRIVQWEEEVDGHTTKATIKKTIRTAYWEQNQNKHHVWRDSLGLKNTFTP